MNNSLDGKEIGKTVTQTPQYQCWINLQHFPFTPALQLVQQDITDIHKYVVSKALDRLKS